MAMSVRVAPHVRVYMLPQEAIRTHKCYSLRNTGWELRLLEGV